MIVSLGVASAELRHSLRVDLLTSTYVVLVEWRIFDHKNYRECQDPLACVHERERWNRSYPTHASNCLVGVENVYNWLEEFHYEERYGAFHPIFIHKTDPEGPEDERVQSIKVKSPGQHGPAHPLSVMVRDFAGRLKPHDGLYWPRTLYTAALDTIDASRPSRPRFQADSESVSDRTWAWDEQRTAGIHHTWHADLWRFPKTLVDAATWAETVKKFREPSSCRFFTMGTIPSMEFYQFGYE